MGVDLAGTDGENALVGGQGLVELAIFVLAEGQAVAKGQVVAVEGDRPLVGGNGLAILALLYVQVGNARKQPGVLAIDRGSLLVNGDRPSVVSGRDPGLSLA